MISPAITDSTTDEELVLIAKAGDQGAIGELVRRHQFAVRQFLARRTGDLSIADDLAQEVFVVAVTRMSTLKDDRTFSGWLLSIARNKFVDYVRAQTRRRKTISEAVENLIGQYELESNNNSEDLEDQARLSAALQGCMQQLKPRSRELVERFYFDDRTAVEIAETTGQKSSAIRMTLMRIRKALAKCIRQQVNP